MRNVILDTDIGGDPDDVFALLLALHSPEIKVDLIVTADEHETHRAKFASLLLRGLDRDVEVVAGKDLGNTRLCLVCDMAESWEGGVDPDYLGAIKRVVDKNEKTCYVCLGPQSNLAAFLEHNPDLTTKIEVLAMGGTVMRGREHNVAYDGPAALKVLQRANSPRYVMKDVTNNTNIAISRGHPVYQQMLGSDSRAVVLARRSVDRFFDGLYAVSFMHDPLTLSCLIDERTVSFEKKPIKMNETGVITAPYLGGREAYISTHADYKRFMKIFEQRMPFRHEAKVRT